MIILVGESASGKSTIEKVLSKEYGFQKTVSYTTRPPRDSERDGVDYHFITEDEYIEKFNSGYFVETGVYNGWHYGTTKEQYKENTVCVLTPHGLRQIRKNFNEQDIKAFYVKVPRRDRLIQILERGDNIEEAIRRNQADVGQYDGIEDEVDKVIYNPSYIKTPYQICDEILDEIRHG